jgi:hypothetical protein
MIDIRVVVLGVDKSLEEMRDLRRRYLASRRHSKFLDLLRNNDASGALVALIVKPGREMAPMAYVDCPDIDDFFKIQFDFSRMRLGAGCFYCDGAPRRGWGLPREIAARDTDFHRVNA